jgi:ribosomal protein S12 methylthiotransferase accessory factor
LASKYGVVRVTDTTRLDRIGIPVFASIRPSAEPNSLCVHAGKGVRREEAKVGAYMEGIEFAAAEFRRRNIKVYESTPRKVANQQNFHGDFVDLCPVLGQTIDPDEIIPCVDAEVLPTGERISVPAELVFFPYNENRAQRLFGTSTNGLCSGNSTDEASLHGLCEVLERDVQAFNFIHDESGFVDLPTEGIVKNLTHRIAEAGLEPVLRYTSNRYGIPYFQAFILEPSDLNPIAISHGTGCHFITEIAAVRALTEAAQSRLSYIHGGRDDLIERTKYFASQEPSAEKRETKRMRARVLSRDRLIAYRDIPPTALGSIEIGVQANLTEMIHQLDKRSSSQTLRVVLTPLDEPLVVVRMIVVGLESFEPSLKRAGPRLRDHVCKWR